jgi:hypothetical protein
MEIIATGGYWLPRIVKRKGGKCDEIHYIKGTEHKIHFLKACIIKSVLYVHVPLVFTFLECLVERK